MSISLSVVLGSGFFQAPSLKRTDPLAKGSKNHRKEAIMKYMTKMNINVILFIGFPGWKVILYRVGSYNIAKSTATPNPMKTISKITARMI